MMWVSSICYLGIMFALSFFPYFVVFIGLRGPKAPAWLNDILIQTDGHVPLLTKGNQFHFFISKQELHKEVAISIATALKLAGFKVWLSQFEARKGKSTDKYGMQNGVRKSEAILLIMTEGIFHRDRFWVTQTEVSYGIRERHKSLIAVTPVGKKDHGFNFDLKCHRLIGHVHPKGCCAGVALDFQPLARAIPVAIDVASYDVSTDTRKHRHYISGIVQRYLAKDLAKEKLNREVIHQRELGVCDGGGSASGGGGVDVGSGGDGGSNVVVTGLVLGRSENKSDQSEKVHADQFDGLIV